ncbi:hypothetical protein CJ030_MR2G004932 [Morella rubra]|uniref:Pentatricopeptide repeat-containing protein n=1 Tax=Morella rubra TaxID=262757 RepID=A0A6A1WE26_9ROSI|nr:hypothetical protein CJ030_MR2G004932 [Morella rubra]
MTVQQSFVSHTDKLLNLLDTTGTGTGTITSTVGITTNSWNTRLRELAKQCQFTQALTLCRQMLRSGDSPNAFTFPFVLKSCAPLSLLISGAQLHSHAIKTGCKHEPYFGLDDQNAVANCLLTMYVKCGALDYALELFNVIPDKGLITWNAMISGCAQNGLASHVLDLYQQMELSGIHPDPVTLVGVLSACAYLGARKVWEFAKARAVFDYMPEKSVVSWTAIIGGYGMHGHGEIAVQLFDEMISAGIRPDRTVFVSVLAACSHAGLTDKGLEYFAAMKMRYGFSAGSRALLLCGGSFRPSWPTRGSKGDHLIYADVELAELAFERVVELEPMNMGYYVLLSNIYCEAEDLEGVLKVRAMMRKQKLKKEPGYSYTEYKGRVHLFFAGDRTHP